MGVEGGEERRRGGVFEGREINVAGKTNSALGGWES